MAVTHDYNCLAHGVFKDSTTGLCPHGCAKEMSSIAYLKPPSFHGGRTAGIDATLRGLAQDHGLTNMNNQNGTGAAYVQDQSFNRAQNDMQRQMMSGQTFASGLGSGDNAIQTAMQSGGYQPGNAIEQVKPLLTQPKVIVEGSYNPPNA